MTDPLPEPFTRTPEGIAIELRGGRALFTTGVDVLLPEDEARVASAIGIPVERWAQDHQVHEHRVRRITAEAELAPWSTDFDGQATTLRDVACVVRTADCLPIALIAPEAVAMVHAGWRGLADGVVEEGVRAMRELGAVDIGAAIGPAAGVCCYEVGDEVHAAFRHHGTIARHGPRADLKAIAAALLVEWGVAEVHDTGVCTICAPPGFAWSHRAHGGSAGRNGGLAWRS